MKWIVPVLAAMGVGLAAAPVLDEPLEPAVEFVGAQNQDWKQQRAAWVGDTIRRNAILTSAVWRGETDR